MADGEANDSAANEVVELEAMSKDGFSWHPCQLIEVELEEIIIAPIVLAFKRSRSSRGLGLFVLYGNSNLEETITDEKEISARIRVRSTPLQGDDCTSIRQGEHVLATQNSHVNGVFYDARVEKAIHVRHSKRIHCRCSFTIKWLHYALPQESSTVPASAIMKLATKNIHLHPTISAFFSMQESPNALDAMPCPMIADEKNWEMDINVLLEQQIKEINSSTDIHQENILKGFASKHKVDLKGQSHSREFEASLKDSLEAVPFQDKLNGFDGNENKQPTNLIAETPPTPNPSIQEELTRSRFLLNPLAARAALASLRSEFPQSLELSAQRKGDMTGQHSTANLPQGSKFCSFSAVDCSSNEEEFSLKISATLEGKSPNLSSIVKKLFPTSSPPHIVEISNLSSRAQINGMEKKNKIGEKKTTLSAEMRLTRSQIQRDNGMHETSQMTENNETQSRLTDRCRVTRSRVKGAEKIEAKECNAAVKDDVLNEFTKFETSPQSNIAPQNCLSDNQRAVASPINGQIHTRRVTRSRVKGIENTEVNKYNSAVKDDVQTGCTEPGTSSQDTADPKYCLSDNQKVEALAIDGDTSIHYVEDERGILEKDGIVVDIDTQKVNLIQNADKHYNPKRLTRSGAREDTENNKVQPKLKQRKRNSIESNVSTERLGIQRSLASPSATKINEQFSEEGESKKILTHVKTAPKSSESSAGSQQGTRHKSASSKQETRFSPRLRYLPRTRSQKKA
ncbi:hypothetical protein C2S51_034013 [Perilla frutescens var. frutescens]|nr:hypothetical protein C2S51_034013 [Perilla frutescens var. frutescens]